KGFKVLAQSGLNPVVPFVGRDLLPRHLVHVAHLFEPVVFLRPPPIERHGMVEYLRARSGERVRPARSRWRLASDICAWPRFGRWFARDAGIRGRWFRRDVGIL